MYTGKLHFLFEMFFSIAFDSPVTKSFPNPAEQPAGGWETWGADLPADLPAPGDVSALHLSALLLVAEEDVGGPGPPIGVCGPRS